MHIVARERFNAIMYKVSCNKYMDEDSAHHTSDTCLPKAPIKA